MAEVKAVPTDAFLNSIGIVTTFADRGQPLPKTIEMLRYGGFRWVRAGIEGLTEDGPTTLASFVELHRQTGVRFSWGLVSGGSDIDKLITTARALAKEDLLIAIEGNNEPNNWPVTYQGRKGGGRGATWLPVAELHRDLYKAVKSDPLLQKLPVWSISEPGGQWDNVGLQFLTIPKGARTLMPDGTQFADVANVHNYLYHRKSPRPADNKVWDAAEPTSASRVDGLYGNFGRTWSQGYTGYSEEELINLPRVTTDTGVAVGGEITEWLHGLHLMNVYLAQFKRNYAHTSVYLLRDRTDETGNQAYGYFRPDYTPRPAAIFLHNLTTILSGTTPGPDGPDQQPAIATPGTSPAPRAILAARKTIPAATSSSLAYAIVHQPQTVHDLLLQKPDGTFQLVVWGERLKGHDQVTIRFSSPQGLVRIYDPTKCKHVRQTRQAVETLELTVSNHPYVIEIQP